MKKTFILGGKTIVRLGFGAMRITGDGIWGEPADHEKAIAVLKKSIELGTDFIDTADAYGPEVSENLIHEALYPYDRLVIATKGGLTRSGPGQWIPDCSPQHLMEACDASLKRLDVKQLTLYQLHTVDPNVPFEDSFKAMLELQRLGKIKQIGLSNIEPEHFEKALQLGNFVSVQNNYSLLNREHEDVLKLCEQNGVMFIPYFPIGGNTGGLSDEVLQSVAEAHGATTRQIGLAWLLQHSSVIVPIPGTSSLEHLVENIAAADIELSADEITKLDALAA
jgi:pyridoxine 4-dehydrogenase